MIASDELTEDFFVTQGVKSNRRKRFHIEQDGKFFYELLQDLERQAEESHHFDEIAKHVLKAIEIRQQLKLQGF